jgi:uncharacterized protein YggE
MARWTTRLPAKQSLFDAHSLGHHIILCVGLALICLSIPTRAGTLAVTGRAERQMAPDLAQISVDIELRRNDAADAQREVESVTAQVLRGLASWPVEERSVQAGFVSIEPVYRWDNPGRRQIFEGYQAKRSVSFRINDLDKLGQVVQELSNSGITRLSPPILLASGAAIAQREALAAAYADAHAQATLLAEAAGLSLGYAESISTDSARPIQSNAPAMARMVAAESDMGTYIPGELTIVSSVAVVFSTAAATN